MKSPSFEQLRAFADVIELGSFSAAADRAGISQPAVSLQIRQLERHLGVRLIERIGRRAHPTPAGADLLVHVRRIQEDIHEAMETVGLHRSGSIGRLRIGTGATACIYLLPPVLRAIKDRMPGLEITVQTGNTPEVLKRVENNVLDLAVVTMPAAGRSLQVTEVYRDELVAVFPADERGPSGRLTPDALIERPLLLYEAGGHTRRIIDRWFADGGVTPKPLMELGSVEAIKQLVGAGLGWSVLPRLAVEDARGAPRVAFRSVSPLLTRGLALVMRRDKHLSRPLRELIAAIEARGLRDGNLPA